FLDDDVSPDVVAADPITAIEANPRRHPRLPPPPQMFGASRRNSTGRDLSVVSERKEIANAVSALAPLSQSAPRPDSSPASEGAKGAFHVWNARGGVDRARVLRAMGDALQANADMLTALIAREAGRGLQDAIDEVREAVDFCRFYAAEAERLFEAPRRLPGPAGETNDLELHGRGVFVCISPWNFPLAIFASQIASALAAGDILMAKPVKQTFEGA